ADYEAVNAFGDAVKQAGKASPEGDGNWAKSTFEDLVQYNDGFKTNLIGTPRQIAERIVALKAAAVAVQAASRAWACSIWRTRGNTGLPKYSTSSWKCRKADSTRSTAAAFSATMRAAICLDVPVRLVLKANVYS
ncbi:hypothetical protein ACV36C_33835, partial [Pseudomonas aeruginosa]